MPTLQRRYINIRKPYFIMKNYKIKNLKKKLLIWFKYEFNPLYQLTELEEAELRSKNATIRASDLNLGIIDEEAALKAANISKK